MEEEKKTEQNSKQCEEPEIIDAVPDLAKMNKAELKAFAEGLSAENEAMKKIADECRASAEQAKKVALQAAEFQTMYTRLKSDFDNYKRRNAEIGETSKADATIALAEKLLPVLDNFARAVAAIKDENTLTGVRMILTQFNDVLEHMNVKKFESLGEDFDHNLHDAVLMQDAEPEQAGKVINVILDGYRYGDRVIRAAKVIVGKEPEQE